MAAQGLIALKSYATKYTKRKELEGEVERLKSECEGLIPAVMRYFERTGTDKQGIRGYVLSPRYELWAGAADGVRQKDLHDALIDTGLEGYALDRMEHMGMSAHVREIFRELEEAERRKPKAEQRLIDLDALYEEIWKRYPELKGRLKISEVLKISVTKAKESAARKQIKGALKRASELPPEVEEDVIN